MKQARQNAIRAILAAQPVQTQEELAEALRSQGYQVTQATVSRDIRELRLIRRPGQEGGYVYAEPEEVPGEVSDRLIRLLRDSVLSVEVAGQMIVVKTMSGAASTAAETLDNLEMQDVLGSIAGDNTIFLAARDHASALAAAERIRHLIE